MKKYLLGLFAVAVAVGFSAFTKPAEKKFASIYMQYNGSIGTAEKVVTNYTQVSGTLATCPSTENRLCWIAVDDVNLDGTIQQSELDAFFVSFDNGDDILSNNNEVTNRLQKRAIN